MPTDEANPWGAAFDGWHADSKPASRDESYTRRHEWQFDGNRLDWELELPVSLYEYCAGRARTGQYGTYLADPLQEPFVESLADRLRAYFAATDLGDYERVVATTRFVQAIEYSLDVEDTGLRAYPKYAIETLFHQRGDCEDGSILLGTLLDELGYDTVMVLMPGAKHMLVGVALDSCSGARFEADGTTYYAVETTGVGWDPGELPGEYQGASARIHSHEDQPVLVHEWSATPAGGNTVDVELHVANFGNGTATGLQANVEFERRDGESVRQRALAYGGDSLAPGESTRYRDTLRLPTDRTLRGRCELGLGGRLHDHSESDWH